MASENPFMDITTARAALSAITKKGVGLPLAGCVYWIVASALFLLLRPRRNLPVGIYSDPA